MKGYNTVKEIAETNGVTPMAVYHWIKQGLPYKTERIIGKKARKVIKQCDVEKFLSLTPMEDGD